MKLLFCPHCNDVRRLASPGNKGATETRCWCGRSWGYYKDEVNAVYGGEAIMLGIANSSLVSALQDQRRSGDRKAYRGWVAGREFAAFLIPDSAPTVERSP